MMGRDGEYEKELEEEVRLGWVSLEWIRWRTREGIIVERSRKDEIQS